MANWKEWNGTATLQVACYEFTVNRVKDHCFTIHRRYGNGPLIEFDDKVYATEQDAKELVEKYIDTHKADLIC